MQRLALAYLTVQTQARVGLIDGDGLAFEAVAHPKIDILAAGFPQRGEDRHGGRLECALLDRGAAEYAPAGAEPPHPARLVLNCEAARLQRAQQAETRGTGAARLVRERRERGGADPRQRLQQVERAAYRGDAIVPRRGGCFMRPVAGAGPDLALAAASLRHAGQYP